MPFVALIDILKLKFEYHYKEVSCNNVITYLEVINLEDGLWVRQVILLQVCIQASSR